MLAPSLTLGQKQLLKLNTQMIQSLEFMTLPISELLERIDQEAEKNPTLVVEERRRDNRVSYEEYISKYSKNDIKEDYSDSSSYGSDLSNSHQAWLEGAIKEEESLEEHLLSQLGCIKLDKEVERVCKILISAIDKRGFFTTSVENILSKNELEYLDDALKILHSLEPIGVCCKDYKESLIIQGENFGLKGDEKRAFDSLVNDHLENMRAGKEKEVCQRLGIEKEDLDALFSFLKTLTPYPGLKYNSSYDEYITPDLSIKVEDDRLVLRVNDSTLPELSIDNEYKAMLDEYNDKKDRSTKEATKYLKHEISSANNLINQLELRRSTLEKVGKVLLEKQKGFFLFGKRSLKPLTLKEVANEIGVHETTVSRITTSKYIDTDFGIMSLKELFVSGIQNDETGQTISKTAIKDIIKEIIENNQSGKALSDQKISDILKAKGITCARRTVSKYRNELNIDTSFIRGS